MANVVCKTRSGALWAKITAVMRKINRITAEITNAIIAFLFSLADIESSSV